MSGMIYSWNNTSSLYSGQWCACSANASVIMVGNNSTAPLLSTDKGVSWNTLTIPITSASMGACSGDGSMLLINGSMKVYKSIDNGVTWTQLPVGALISPTNFLKNMACSFDGSHITCCSNTKVFSSIDYGESWYQGTGTSGVTIYTVASSYDGSVLIFGGSNSYVSTDYGISWSLYYNYGFIAPVFISYGGNIRLVGGTISTDSGATWKILGSSITMEALSSDGSRIVVTYNTTLLTSIDYGKTFDVQTGAQESSWNNCACSEDASFIVAVARIAIPTPFPGDGYVHVGQATSSNISSFFPLLRR